MYNAIARTLTNLPISMAFRDHYVHACVYIIRLYAGRYSLMIYIYNNTCIKIVYERFEKIQKISNEKNERKICLRKLSNQKKINSKR